MILMRLKYCKSKLYGWISKKALVSSKRNVDVSFVLTTIAADGQHPTVIDDHKNTFFSKPIIS
ncbi:hypothetical protein COLO4_33332 [Corchorus olitorius]|uniref:Uncharacterized protein n=1 Tax=Corchorus olitorius TaxID=93759 RepID=A0A1R3GUR4_9ROSI|nr:hypothetical protein COLO4_33332 [Corchorus olitorius]